MIRFVRLFIIMLFAAITMPAVSGADKPNVSREQWAEMQARHIAEDLKLDEATTQKFVNTFCQYQKAMWGSWSAAGPMHVKDESQLTDSYAEQILKNRIAHQRMLNDIQEKYFNEYSKFLTPTQILKAQDLERKMMDQMFKQRDKKRRPHSGKRGGRP